MGLGIGQVTGPLASLRSAPEVGQTRLAERESPLRPPNSSQTEDGVEAFLRRQAETGSRGRATALSTPGAALRTISTTVEQARERIPTIQEIRLRFRTESAERRADAQRTAFNRPGGDSTRRIELQIPDPSAQVRNFVTDTDNSRSDAFTQVGEGETGASVRLGANRDESERTVSLTQPGEDRAEVSFAKNDRTTPVAPEIPAQQSAAPGAPEPTLIDTQVIRNDPEPVGFTQAQATGTGASSAPARDAEASGPRFAEAGSQLDVSV